MLMLALMVSCFMMAQQPSPSAPDAGSSQTSGPQSPQWRGLSVKEKLRYDARHLFDVDNVVYAGSALLSTNGAIGLANGVRAGARLRNGMGRTLGST